MSYSSYQEAELLLHTDESFPPVDLRERLKQITSKAQTSPRSDRRRREANVEPSTSGRSRGRHSPQFRQSTSRSYRSRSRSRGNSPKPTRVHQSRDDRRSHRPKSPDFAVHRAHTCRPRDDDDSTLRKLLADLAQKDNKIKSLEDQISQLTGKVTKQENDLKFFRSEREALFRSSRSNSCKLQDIQKILNRPTLVSTVQQVDLSQDVEYQPAL